MWRKLALWLPALAWAGLMFHLSAGPAIYTSESSFLDRTVNGAGHAAEYAVLATLVYLPLTGAGRRRDRRLALLAVGVACAFGASDELHQSFVPGRDADSIDWLVDCVAAAATVLVLARLAPSLRERWHRPRVE